MLERQEDQTKSVLAHEMAHQYGAPDHYHRMNPQTGRCENLVHCPICGRNPRTDSTCIMNNSDINIDRSFLTCDECTADIISHLESHHQ